MRFSAHHVSHVLSSEACLPRPGASPVGVLSGGGVVGPVGAEGVVGVVGPPVVGGAPVSGGVVVGGGVAGGGGGGSLGSRRPGGTEPPGFLNRMQASAPSIGSTSGVTSRAGRIHERRRIEQPPQR